MNDELENHLKSLNTKGIDMTKVDLENTAIDKEAYHKWTKLINLPQIKNRDYTASDGRIIKMGSPKPVLEKQMAGLPDDEIEMFLKKKGVYDSLMMKANTLKMKAFGLFHTTKKPTTRVVDKLLEARRIDLLELFGRMFSVQEVHDIVVNEWEIPVSIEHIITFRTENNDLIEDKIKAHQAGWADIRLGVKRSRLEEYCWIYSESKTKYLNLGSREDLKLMMNVLEKIKGEVEVDQLNLKVDGKMEVEVTVNQHIQREVLSGLALRQLIVGRVAARQKVSPAYIIARLSNSYYAKFATAPDETVDVTYEDVKYPTKEHYDFDQIKKQHEEQQILTNNLVENERLRAYQHGISANAESAKESILTLLKSEKAKLGIVKSSADVMELNRDLAANAQLSTRQKLAKLLKS